MPNKKLAAQFSAMLVLSASSLVTTPSVASDKSSASGQTSTGPVGFLEQAGYSSDRFAICNSTLYEIDKNTGNVLGKFSLKETTCSPPLIVDGITYVITYSGVARAIKSGKELWKAKIADTDLGYDVLFAEGDYLFIGGFKSVNCIQRSSGKTLWQSNLSKQMLHSNKMLYAIDASNKLRAVEIATGKTRWTADGLFRRDVKMLIAGDALYICHAREFYKTDLASGKTVWKKDLPFAYSFSSFFAISPNQLAAASRDGGVAILDCATGASYLYAAADKEKFQTGSDARSYSRADVVLLNKGILYVGGNSGGTGIGGSYMSAMNPATKKQLWLTPIDEKSIRVAIPSPAAAPVVFKNELIFPLEIGLVYALNTSTGKLIWKSDTGRSWQGWTLDRSPAVFLSGDTVCVYDSRGVSAINAADGKKLWSFDTNGAISRTPIQDSDRLYLQTVDGTAYAIDLSAQKLKWSLAADDAKSKANAVVVRESGAIMSTTFSPEAWKNAKKQPGWSRQKMMEEFSKQYRAQMDGMNLSRTKVLSLLGEPEMSYEYPQSDSEGLPAKKSEFTDVYQLSARSGRFEVAYDENNIVKRYSWSDEPCRFKEFVGAKPAKITVEQAKKASSMHNIADVKKLLGEANKEELDIPPNFPTPFRFSSYYWNLSNDGRKLFWVRTSGHFDEDKSKRSIDVTCIITLSNDCPLN